MIYTCAGSLIRASASFDGQQRLLLSKEDIRERMEAEEEISRTFESLMAARARRSPSRPSEAPDHMAPRVVALSLSSRAKST